MINKDELISLIKNIDLFNGLKNEIIEEIVNLGKIHKYNEHETIFEEGDPGDKMFIVVEGLVKISMATRDGFVVLSRFSKGDLFGEMAVIDELERTATAKTVTHTTLLEIGHDEFFLFVKDHPNFAISLLKMISRRLRVTNSLFAEVGKAPYGIGGERQTPVDPLFDVSMVGYGRYGSLHIGPKYAKRGYLWDVTAIVDPLMDHDKYEITPLGNAKPDIGIYHSFEEWNESYFQQLSEEEKNLQAIEVSLRPGVVYKAVMPYIEWGVKNIILPKPVVTNDDELDALTEAANEHRTKVAISSQWHYSDFPLMIRREIKRLANVDDIKDAKLYKVEIDFSKENGTAISTTPPLSEMPHVLQLVESTGLLDLTEYKPHVSGTESLVEVDYFPPNIEKGIHLKADLEFVPKKNHKRKYPDWDIQIRTFKVYLTAESKEPEIEVDFWIKFDRTGDVAIRPGHFLIRDENEAVHHTLGINFIDDQLLKMNYKIFESFKQDFDSFQKDPSVLTLERYNGIGHQLMVVERLWQETQT